MEQHYREHVIVYDTCQDSKTQLWLGSATVRFAEGTRVNVVAIPGPFEPCMSKDEAQERFISAARGWIDSRLDLSRGSASELSAPQFAMPAKETASRRPIGG
jgi:hypothetical protein